MAENGTLTEGQTAFLAALMSCATIRAAAIRAGISESTAYRWLRDTTVKAELDKMQREMLDMAVISASIGLGKARQALLDVALDTDAPATARVAAARALLVTGTRTLERYAAKLEKDALNTPPPPPFGRGPRLT